MFEWWEPKRLRILRDRELDFQDAVEIFDGRPTVTFGSYRNNEERFVTIGPYRRQVLCGHMDMAG